MMLIDKETSIQISYVLKSVQTKDLIESRSSEKFAKQRFCKFSDLYKLVNRLDISFIKKRNR